ncbi:MAG: hypothetical protein GX230_07525 [Lentisphaerae bacterium]|nr:hypothetical protein [Lentisphaerota bacterium]
MVPLLIIALFVTTAAVAAPQEDTFIRIWGIHRQANVSHTTVINTCREAANQRAENDQPLLASYYPVIRTIEGWHLLQTGRHDEATKALTAALDTQRSNDPLIRAADSIARRWLSRLDREQIVAALKKYHRDNVEFPPDLSIFNSLPQADRPPLRDRMGNPWVYRLAEFRRLKHAHAQRYLLYSIAIGRETSTLATALNLPYIDTPITYARKNNTSPVMVELTIGTLPDTRTAIVQEGNRFEDIRFLAIDSRNRFMLLCNDDFWLTALPARR